MLKNVVLPAPLGPMIETIDRSGTLNVTSLTAVRPPNCFVTCSASSTSGPPDCRGSPLVVSVDVISSLTAPARPARPPTRRGAPACAGAPGSGPPAHDHHDHQQEAVDRE